LPTAHSGNVASFNVEGVRACYERHLSGLQDFSELLWLVLTYEMWARNYLDRRGSGRLTVGGAK